VRISQTNDVKTVWNLRFSRFSDITHETVVRHATDVGILRKCSICFCLGLFTL